MSNESSANHRVEATQYFIVDHDSRVSFNRSFSALYRITSRTKTEEVFARRQQV